MFKTTSEYIATIDNLEVWGVKYTFKSWRTRTPLCHKLTGKLYNPGNLCFALISYIDEEGNFHQVDEDKYFEEEII